MRAREPRWKRFAQAAVEATFSDSESSPTGRLREQAGSIRRQLIATSQEQRASAEPQRPDIRLLPSVVSAWTMAAAAIGWSAETVHTVLLLGGAVLGAAACRWLWWYTVRRKLSGSVSPVRARAHTQVKRPLLATSMHWPAGMSATVLLASLCLLGVLLAVQLRSFGTAASELDRAVAKGEDMALTLEVATVPVRRQGQNGPAQFAFDGFVIHATVQGRTVSGRVPVKVLAAAVWAGLKPGDRAWTAGRIVPTGSRDRAAGFLHPATAPMSVVGGADDAQTVVRSMRAAWRSSVDSVWADRSPDTAGLLPGMVMGDRSGMASELNDAMKTVGLTHLTAVSGANCTLVLASLMLILRSVHTPRLAVFVVSGAALMGFVVLVGPDPSVLRAAVMGAIGTMAMLGGRPKHTGALLSVSVIILLVADPWLAVDYAFILSVLATAGLHVVGRRCVGWLSVWLPLWLAQAVAIPLAAQLFCAPVIVLLQARLTPYAIPANMAAAPVVALVTTVGTLGLLTASMLPPLAELCAAASGAGAWWVAAVARWMSGLPAASLPWPSAGQGVVLMACLNAAVLAGLFAIVERERLVSVTGAFLGYLPLRWRSRYGFATVAIVAAALTAWWTAAVAKL